MVGLFVTALVGAYTIEDLWEKFGDTKLTFVRFLPNPVFIMFTSWLSTNKLDIGGHASSA